MILALFRGPMSTWAFPDFLILAIIIGGCIGVTIIILRECGITIPPYVWRIFWIVLACFLGIIAIRLIASM